jgi:hypothetical protein
MLSSIALLSSVALAQHGLPEPCLYPLQFTAQMHTFYYGKNLMEVCKYIPTFHKFDEIGSASLI